MINSPRSKAHARRNISQLTPQRKSNSSLGSNLRTHTQNDRHSLVLNAVGRESESTTKYDVIVVGSGNGACALINECLAHAPHNKDYKILVLEQGRSFFFTSDYTH